MSAERIILTGPEIRVLEHGVTKLSFSFVTYRKNMKTSKRLRALVTDPEPPFDRLLTLTRQNGDCAASYAS
jgi:hypothetical protein